MVGQKTSKDTSYTGLSIVRLSLWGSSNAQTRRLELSAFVGLCCAHIVLVAHQFVLLSALCVFQ